MFTCVFSPLSPFQGDSITLCPRNSPPSLQEDPGISHLLVLPRAPGYGPSDLARNPLDNPDPKDASFSTDPSPSKPVPALPLGFRWLRALPADRHGLEDEVMSAYKDEHGDTLSLSLSSLPFPTPHVQPPLPWYPSGTGTSCPISSRPRSLASQCSCLPSSLPSPLFCPCLWTDCSRK